MNGELKLSVICLLEEVLRDPDLLPQERKATANILRYTTERSQVKQQDTMSESWTDLHFKALLSRFFFIVISYFFFPTLVYSGCFPSTPVMSYPTLPRLNYSPLLQCPFSRWAGRRPAEDRGHPADGKQHLRRHSLKMLIFSLPRRPLIKHSPQLVFFSYPSMFVCYSVLFCFYDPVSLYVFRPTVRRQSVSSHCQPWSLPSRSLCWITSSSGAFLMSQSSHSTPTGA